VESDWSNSWIPLRLFLLTLVVAALAGCSARGASEFQLYAQAFDSQAVQGEAVLDRLAKAERIIVGRRATRSTAIPDFKPNDAAYYVQAGDPPLTASIRSSLKSLKSYNDALSALASGETATALSNRVGTIVTNLIAAAGTFSATGAVGAAVAGASGFAASASSAVSKALPILSQIATYASREAFRRELIAAYPHLRDLLLELRSGTPVMFEIFKRSYRTARENPLDHPGLGMSPADLTALNKDRELLAGWVLLLDKSLEAMDTAVAAAMARISPTDLAALTEASIELKILAEKMRELRAGQ
jgi:hypothetical protein